MKKYSLVFASLLSVLAMSNVAFAATPHQEKIRFECPNASGGTASERLTNFGTYIRGMGEENVGSSKKFLPIFNGVTVLGMPLNLADGAYKHAGTQYNPSNGRVTCLYTSSLFFPSFNVSYIADNAKHGYVKQADDSAITVYVNQG